jgi:hypothetical protein
MTLTIQPLEQERDCISKYGVSVMYGRDLSNKEPGDEPAADTVTSEQKDNNKKHQRTNTTSKQKLLRYQSDIQEN